MSAIKETHFNLPGQSKFYKGKVRDVYTIENNFLVMVVTDRISAFDVVLPEPIPFKGQVLNQIAAKFLAATQDIVPNWVLDVPDPNVTIGKICDPFKVEMVIRGYLAGHAWREYQSGKRSVCGVSLPEGLKENDKLPVPIITPTTKASVGHDEDISREEILSRNIVSEEDYIQLEKYTRALFQRGTEMAADQGLILVDTKYEFGKADSKIHLIDEIHTPDSSRYFYKEGYEERQKNNEQQKQLSKEFVRKWLIDNGFQGKEDQLIPEMTPEFVKSISDRYIELYEQITGDKFIKHDHSNALKRVENNIIEAINRLS
ncbi:MAG: phosphoribosylaminoimidazolesuccinocarboxamide synthase [Sphingobacteriales bacterium 17-39-43]|uniref:phosphoribosylaminoimidazolesuccinocarboxamide synthase n=1 Tax=Daejeonella sp. TaxID=2805397 RepID=UPI000BC5D1D9|nr:phosphoribosylaminoimidazolesuccinocarboxamide synthase [Daejeonella sp.]OYZ32927.1 MAG: phosphoribosylaminoimidazolesuccinocarboxamide synthase [Sphingobacteriales bacterium 16-39-50]OZA26337.1 MAG: phosphoribosylaminoimidazolesuccinocarboxamide synthase [Sphingobacteriales bacterium 17-39-43]HQS51673.1 phosphoribosylaminoimidazolesuccinocarboxamide synthase [Daejeonella sp.]HQT21463.1 phosphoribosylaminoimidazolesuccinocarboxamide synthase [Daejeonella sp.]HQT56194.1 phosphoribosylaminoim